MKAFLYSNRKAGSIVAVGLFLFLTNMVQGATRTWDGSASSFWSNPANWVENTAPVDGDELVFPSVALNKTMNNDIVGLSLGGIEVQAALYVFNGNGIGLSGRLEITTISGINTDVNLDINLDANATIYTIYVFNNIFITGDIDLDGYNLRVGGYGTVRLQGAISGAGSVTKYGNYNVYMEGSAANTYTGNTTVEDGTLILDQATGNSVPRDLIIEDGATVRQEAGAEIGTDVTIYGTGSYDMNGFNETILDLNLYDGADFDSGASTLTIAGEVTVDDGTSTIDGTLSLYTGTREFNILSDNMLIFPNAHCYLYADLIGAGSFIKTGPGVLRISGNNTYSGETIVETGLVQVQSATAFGSTAAGTTFEAGSRMYISVVSTLSSINVVGEALTLGGNISSYGLANSWDGDITLTTNVSFYVSPADSLDLSGSITGAGGITYNGDGTLIYSGSSANSYSGDTIVNEGTLLLSQSAFNAIGDGTLTIGNGTGANDSVIVRLTSDFQIWDFVDIIVNSDGWLDYGAYTDTIGGITLNEGRVSSSTGTVRLNGNVIVNGGSSESRIQGNLYVGSGTRTFDVSEGTVGYELRLSAVVSGGGILKTGAGLMALTAPNTYSGTTTVNQGRLYILDDNALGATGSGTAITDGGFLYLVGVTVTNETLTLNRTLSGSVLYASSASSWSGDITLDHDSTIGSGSTLELSGAISGNGGLTYNGLGTLRYSGTTANTYSGPTRVNGGTLELAKTAVNASIVGDLYVGNGSGGVDADVVRLFNTSQIPNIRITMASSGLLDLNNITEYYGSLAGSGHVTLGSGNMRVGLDNTSSTFSGLIEGSGNVEKYGSGTFTLSGNNTHTGTTRAGSGTLLVNGSQSGSAVSVESIGTLGGIGTVGQITSSGSVAPGESPGQLGAGTTALNAGSSFDVEINGYTLVNYDQLDVNGSVSLTNPNLNINWGYVPAVGDSFTILDNDGADAVSGTFNGLPEGSSLVAANVTVQVSYAGGTGNDVVLSVTAVNELEPLEITSMDIVGTNVELTWIGGVPYYVVEWKSSLTNATWIPLTAPTRDMDATIPIVASNAFYRVTGGN